jgi:hypothetical protein
LKASDCELSARQADDPEIRWQFADMARQCARWPSNGIGVWQNKKGEMACRHQSLGELADKIRGLLLRRAIFEKQQPYC